MEANMTELTAQPIDRMLAAALLAQETNGEYIGTKSYSAENKPKNKSLMAKFLLENDPQLEERTAAAEEMMAYCQTKMIELLSGELTGYWKAILEVVNKPTILPEAHSDWGVIASIPSAYMRAVERDNAQDRRAAAQRTSMHFGKVGDQYEGKVHLISKIFSIKYNKTWYTGVDEHGNLVNFPYSKSLIVDREYPVKAKIRKHGEDATTLLHYVNIPVDSLT